jgi:hypothetical protein
VLTPEPPGHGSVRLAIAERGSGLIEALEVELAAGNLLSVMESVQTTQHSQTMIYGLGRGFGLLIQLVTGIIEQGGFSGLRQRRAFRPPTYEILVARIALQRPKIKVTFRDVLRQVRIVASRKHDVNIRAVWGCEIVQAKILLAARLLINGCMPARLMHFVFESSRKDGLRATTHIKWCGLIHFRIDPEFLGPESPPECDEKRKSNRDPVSISAVLAMCLFEWP